MKFSILPILALAGVGLAAPLNSTMAVRSTTNSTLPSARSLFDTSSTKIDASVMEKMPGLLEALQKSQGGVSGGAALNLTSTAGSVADAASGVTGGVAPAVLPRAPQIDVAGILEKLPGVIGALKGGKGYTNTTTTPSAGGASGATGLEGVLEQLPGVIGALQKAKGQAGAAPMAAGALAGAA